MSEETRAALAAVALNWSNGHGYEGTYYRSRISGHITRRTGESTLCRSWALVGHSPVCTKCALIWYREVRDG